MRVLKAQLRSLTALRSLTSLVALLIACLTLSACGQSDNEQVDVAGRADWPVREERVRENMRQVQLAVEHYAADHGSCNYPQTIDDAFKTYLPGGIEGEKPSPVGPANPFSGMNEFPSLGHTITDVKAIRFGKPLPMRVGVIEYTPLNGGTSYAIVAGGHDGNMLMDPVNPGQVLVLSNE